MSRYPMPATPDGWYCVALAQDVAVGEVRALRYFGRELVAYRGEDGEARVWDAHCPHLGAHLGCGGSVHGSSLCCPFHGWRFDGEGRLEHVPRLTRTPPDIRVRSYPVCERDGLVFAFVHARGEAPGFEIPVWRKGPREAWTEWEARRYTVRVHVQDLSENILDLNHFQSVHDMGEPDPARFEVRFEGAAMIVEQTMKVTAVSEEGIEIVSRTTNCGPGVSAVEVSNGPLEMLTYIAQTPLDDEQVELRLLFSMKKLADPEATGRVAALNAKITNEQFLQDVPIWENKVYREQPALLEVDGPIAEYRRWYRQFYSAWEPA